MRNINVEVFYFTNIRVAHVVYLIAVYALRIFPRFP